MSSSSHLKEVIQCLFRRFNCAIIVPMYGVECHLTIDHASY